MLDSLVILLCLIGLGSSLMPLVARVRGAQTQPAPYYAVTAITFGLASVVNAFMGDTVNSYIQAVGAAVNGWLWWQNGGGDDTKRRLKSWASRFQGVRRTAPSHA